MRQHTSKIVSVPWVRRLVIDAGRASRRRHAIHGLFEVDVTRAREALRAYRLATGVELSFTAYVVSCVARAVAAEPSVQAYRDLRGREVIFDEVDVGLPIEVEMEGSPFAFTHVIRDAGSRSVEEIHREIRAIQADPSRSPSVHKEPLARAYLLLPGAVRTGLLGALHGGWGIAFQLHTLSIVIGGITVRPALCEGQLVEREWLQLTVSVDHDIVDGAPTARFVTKLRGLLMSAEGLPVIAADSVNASPAPGLRESGGS